MTEAYPLHWPVGRERTPSYKREYSRFSERGRHGYSEKISHTKSLNTIQIELDRLGAKNIVLSTNLELLLDGLPRAGQRKPDDVGVACYFTLKGKQLCMACDKYNRVEDNIYAIGKTIEAMRAIERWGSKDMLDAAFSGFKALPAPEDIISTCPRYFDECQTKDEIHVKYRSLAKEMHPNAGGSNSEWLEMKRQYDQVMNK